MTFQKHTTALVQPWLSDLKFGYNKNITSPPTYFLHSPSTSLITTSNLHALHLGTGESIYNTLLPLLEAANEEVILVTCFWAASSTQKLVNDALRKLSGKGKQRGRKIRVRICFSSSGILQKLLHPQSLAGKVYSPESWQPSLHLPDPHELEGLDMQVKSIFLLPFSVMHPKFIIVDRKVAVLPSCNVSWEDWFEGAVTLTGPVVSCFVDFWREFWAQPEDRDELLSLSTDSELEGLISRTQQQHQPGNLPIHQPLSLQSVPTIFLPSPNNRNPSFRLPWQESAPPPPTPLNTFFLRSLASAEREIYIQTPNLTCSPVLSAILRTLRRGINIHIVTSEKLMILEQLVTSGTTTSRCISKLISRYHALCAEPADPEAGRPKMGDLRIEYFTPRGQGRGEPQQSHLKCTIVDGELVILGSGNLDRASWFTSQELGVAFFDKSLAGVLKGELREALRGRVKRVL